jgi:hypothetical protein
MSQFDYEISTEDEFYSTLDKHSCIFFTTNSEFCKTAEQQFLQYLDVHRELLPKSIKFYKFTVTVENAGTVEVGKVPQIRYYKDEQEKLILVGKVEIPRLVNLFKKDLRED